jgi:hypothetical protein
MACSIRRRSSGLLLGGGESGSLLLQRGAVPRPGFVGGRGAVAG